MRRKIIIPVVITWGVGGDFGWALGDGGCYPQSLGLESLTGYPFLLIFSSSFYQRAWISSGLPPLPPCNPQSAMVVQYLK